MRDKNGEIRRKRGDTQISTLREEYGQTFAPGYPPEATLGMVPEAEGLNRSINCSKEGRQTRRAIESAKQGIDMPFKVCGRSPNYASECAQSRLARDKSGCFLEQVEETERGACGCYVFALQNGETT